MDTFQPIDIAPIAVRTASGVGDPVDLNGFSRGIQIIIASNPSGNAGKNIVFKLQESDTTDDLDFEDIHTFDAIANFSAIEIKSFAIEKLKRYIRMVWTITGVNPTGESVVILLAGKQEIMSDHYRNILTLVPQGTSVFGFSYVTRSGRDQLKFSDLTNKKVNLMANNTYTIVSVTNVQTGSVLTGDNYVISEKKTDGFCFASTIGVEFEFVISGAIAS